MDRTGDVEEGLVDRYPFDERREVAEHLDHLVSERLVAGEVAADELQARTEPPCPPAGHPRHDPERLRLVRGCQHDTLADCDRSPFSEGSSSCSTEA